MSLPADVDLWYTRCPAPTATGIAHAAGWLQREFAEDGVRLRTLQDPDNFGRLQSHFSHDEVGLVREGGNVPPLWARAGGAPTRLIGLTWIDEFQGVVTTGSSPLATAADLVGQRVGVPRNDDPWVDFHRSYALRGVANALRSAGLDLDDVKVVEVDTGIREAGWAPGDGEQRRPAFSTEVDALLAGEVDAIYVKGARGLDVTTDHGLRPLVNLAEHPDPLVRANIGYPRTITAHQRLLDERPDLVTRFLASLLRAAGWADENPARVTSIVAAETGGTEASTVAAYAYGLDLRPRLDRGWLDALQDHASFLRRHGFLAGPVDVASWVDRAPLDAARALVEAGAGRAER